MGKSPVQVLADASPDAATAFNQLRRAVESGPLDPGTVELVVIAGLASVGQIGSLGVHVRRALKLGTPVEHIRHAVTATLCASGLFNHVVDALREVESIHQTEVAAP
jgi:alkylhydroperoxidase/carboxymuconolactone decarboxylase family protein YurZ